MVVSRFYEIRISINQDLRTWPNEDMNTCEGAALVERSFFL